MKINRPQGVGYAILAVVVCFVLLAVGGLSFTNWRINDNNKKQCEVITLIHSPGPDAPSPAPDSRADKIVKSFKDLGKEYGCH